METERVDAVVLGGGISGLTAGFWLERQGLEVRVVEARDEPGGAIRTWREGGFLFELGPNTVLDNAPVIDALCRAVGVDEERIGAQPGAKRRFVVKGGRLAALPSSPPAFLRSKLFSWRAKLRLLREPFVGRAKSEESIAAFARRRLGQEMLDYAIAPFVSGVYAGDPEQLSVEHATAKIWALEVEHGSLIRGAIAKRKGPAPAGGLFSFASGLERLPRGLAGALGTSYRGGTRATAVEPLVDGRYRVRLEGSSGKSELLARTVVVALAARPAASVLAPLDGGADAFPARIAELPYADVAVVSLGFRREDVGHALDGFGFLAPSVERRHVLGCLFPSSLFADRAPEGHVALSAFVGGAMHPERARAEPEAILRATLEDLRPLLDLRGDPVVSRVERWLPAIPQYVLGHGAHKERGARFESAHPGVYLSGNVLHGVSVADCIRNASELAERVAETLA